MKWLNTFAPRILVVWILLLGTLYSALSILRHNHFQSGAFDLGIYDQAVWQHAHFLSPYNTFKERLIFGDHLTPTLLLISPIFYLWNDVRMLLIFQAFFLAFSSWGIYKLARYRDFTPFVSLIISIVYSIFYGVQMAVFFDFHPVIIAVGLFPWLTFFFETKRKYLFITTLILILLTIENMGIAVAAFAFMYLLKKNFRKSSIALIMFGLATSFLALKVVSLFSPIGYEYTPQIPQNPIEIVTSFFDHPDKRNVLLYTFSSFSFLPLLSPPSVFAVFFDLSQYFITGDALARMWSPFTHHRAILSIFLVLGFLDSLALLKKKGVAPEKIAIAMLIVTIGLQYFFHFPLNKLSKPSYWQEEQWMRDNNELLKHVPTSTSVVAQQSIAPHLSHRKEIYLAWPRQHDGKWRLEFAGKPEYLVIDLHPNQWITQLLETNENFQSAVSNMENAGKIVLEKQIGDAKLYRIIY